MAGRLFVRRGAKIGIALYGLSAGLAAAAIAATAYARAYNSVMLGLAALGAMALMPVAYSFARRARLKIFPSYEALEQYVAQRGESLFVFLREFGSDAVSDHTSGEWTSAFVSQEERIANHFQQYGTVVAIGRPGERLPAGGCFRIYVGDDIWKSVVGRLIEQADLVLFRCGNTQGVSWELEQIIAQKLEKTIFIPCEDAQKNTPVLDRLRKIIDSRPTESDVSLGKTMEIGRQILARPDFFDEEFRDKLKVTLETLQRTNTAMKIAEQAVAFFAPLVRIKDGALAPVEGDLRKALEKVTNELRLRRKGWATLKLWATVVVLFGGPAIAVASHFICGASGCGVLDPYLVYAFIGFAFMILFFGFFTIA